ncbi:elongation factor P hydroxylase [Thalassotalea aquiviva]|uniref:elongation factor P hydroxylase n=1 Tax=Thalassotalea aquiviva TaxID=3242415 RepID=UPI00352B4C49
MTHHYQQLIDIFAAEFSQTENTRLVKGDNEPVYLPANELVSYHRIVFAHGFFASALHEISHWCIAGPKRLLLEDFGYWYAPDGRNEAQQAEFEKVEIKPQALEWAFCVACGFEFNVSADNLNGAEVDRFAFQSKVQQQVLIYLQNGFPKRAQRFIDALIQYYRSGLTLEPALFEFSHPLANYSQVSERPYANI